MKYPSLFFILLYLVLQSCGTSKAIDVFNEEYNYSDQEIRALSKDCEYVKMQLNKGLIKWKNSKLSKDEKRLRKKTGGAAWAKQYKRYERKFKSSRDENQYEGTVFFKNDFLISLLEETPCFDGYNEKQIIELFGENSIQCFKEDCLSTYLEYHFRGEGNSYDYFTFHFQDHRLSNTRVMSVTLYYSH